MQRRGWLKEAFWTKANSWATIITPECRLETLHASIKQVCDCFVLFFIINVVLTYINCLMVRNHIILHIFSKPSFFNGFVLLLNG